MAETKRRYTRRNRATTAPNRAALEAPGTLEPTSGASDPERNPIDGYATTDIAPSSNTQSQARDSQDTPVPGPAFEVEASPTPVGSPNTPKWAKWKSKKQAKEQAQQSVVVLLTILDGAVGMALGPECSMTPDERQMIEEPLTRIMMRLAPATTEAIDKWTDPIMLAFGFALWGARVFAVVSRNTKDTKAGTRNERKSSSDDAQTQAFSGNGSSTNVGNVSEDIARLFGE